MDYAEAERWFSRYVEFCNVCFRLTELVTKLPGPPEALCLPEIVPRLWAQALREKGGALSADESLYLLQLDPVARAILACVALREMGMTAAGAKKFPVAEWEEDFFQKRRDFWLDTGDYIAAAQR